MALEQQAPWAILGKPSRLASALMKSWFEVVTADCIRHSNRAGIAARRQLAARALGGLEFGAETNAFNIWLKLPAGAGRAELWAGWPGAISG